MLHTMEREKLKLDLMKLGNLAAATEPPVFFLLSPAKSLLRVAQTLDCISQWVIMKTLSPLEPAGTVPNGNEIFYKTGKELIVITFLFLPWPFFVFLLSHSKRGSFFSFSLFSSVTFTVHLVVKITLVC